ncbi:YqhA family protein [Deinococcus sp.]|uniref:YqhA family protein n=1 Tax=Deinococcus sp. TaxID=47478 RepID=UPI0025C43EDF|nr:YqhA family protein [Deinococcus sp.]
MKGLEPAQLPPHQGRPSWTVGKVFGLTRFVVELGVLSALAFSVTLFVAAIVQAYHTVVQAMSHLSGEDTAKHLMIAAVEQADMLLVGLALLIISLGMQALFVGKLQNVPSWLHIRSFEDLKQKLIGIVITALAVNFFSVALEWKGGSDILIYGLALASIIFSLGFYSVILNRQSHAPADDRTQVSAG